MAITTFTNVNVLGDLFVTGTQYVPGAGGGFTRLIDSWSTTTQENTATDTPLQLEFGGPQTSDGGAIELAANGAVTFVDGGTYRINCDFQIAQESTSGPYIMLFQPFLNGSVDTDIPMMWKECDDTTIAPSILPNQAINYTWTKTYSASDVLTIEMASDSGRVNYGGVFVLAPQQSGWAATPSCRIYIDEVTV